MQCFVVSSNEIEGRIDPLFYHPKYLQVIHKLQKSKYEIKRIGDICSRIVDGPFGTQLKVENYTTEGIPVVRVSNVKSGEISENNLVKISLEKHAELKRSRVLPNDVLLTKAGAILGYSAVFPSYLKEGNITSHLVTITCKPEVNPHYLKTFFLSDVGQEQIYRWGNKSTRPELNTEEVKKIFIPIPSIETQNQIVDIMQSAYAHKKQMESEAQRLLDAIDGYVLDELGIKLPQVEDKMCFVVNSEEVRENRTDAYYYQPRFIKLIEAVRRSSFEIKTLENISTKIINGLDFRKFSEVGVPYLRVSNIKPNSFDISDIKFIPAFSISKDIELDSGDLLITRKGTYGISVIVDNEHKSMVISSEIFRVILKKDNINPHYIAIWLNSNIAKQLFNRISTGGIMGHVSQDALKNIQIILPPLEIQNKIADEVKRRISEAERLKAEATKIIEEAKKQVEEMIL